MRRLSRRSPDGAKAEFIPAIPILRFRRLLGFAEFAYLQRTPSNSFRF